MGHIGLTPQSINTLGSFRAQGREEGSWQPIENDARAIAQAGAFSVVIEAVAEPLARKITETIAIPPSASAPARPATGKSWCWRICWACRRGRRNLSAATATRTHDRGRDRGLCHRCALRAFPGPEHVYGMKAKS